MYELDVEDATQYPFIDFDQASFVVTRSLLIEEIERGAFGVSPASRSPDGHLVHQLTLSAAAGPRVLRDYVPVIASGSNASPRQLVRKLAAIERLPVAPVVCVRAEVPDVVAVYSGHVSSYGAIPTTLRHEPGVSSHLFVTFIHSSIIGDIHRSENVGVNYMFCLFDPGSSGASGATIKLDDGQAISAAYAYISRHGSLIVDKGGGKKRVVRTTADLQSGGRGDGPGVAMSQTDVLRYVSSLQAKLAGGPSEDAKTFAARMKADRFARVGVTNILKSHVLPPTDVCFEPVEGRNGLNVERTTPVVKTGVEGFSDGEFYVLFDPRAIYPETLQDGKLYCVEAFHPTALRVLRALVWGRASRDREQLRLMNSTAAPGVGLSQTIRIALGHEYDQSFTVSIHPVEAGLSQLFQLKFSHRFFGYQVLYGRISKPLHHDYEKDVARMMEDNLALLGLSSGDKCVLETVSVQNGRYRLRQRAIRLVTANENAIKLRESPENVDYAPQLGARFVATREILNIKSDHARIYIDADTRTYLMGGDANGDPAYREPAEFMLQSLRVRRSNRHLLSRESLALLISIIALWFGISTTAKDLLPLVFDKPTADVLVMSALIVAPVAAIFVGYLLVKAKLKR